MAKQTGWPGGVSRQNFRASQGLNVTSPLNEALGGRGESTLWTRFDVPNTVAIFRRHPVRATPHTVYKGGFNLMNIGSMHFSIFKEHNPPFNDGDLVYPRVEIRLDGQPHSGSWARLGDLQIWSDHVEASSVAVYFDHQDSQGNWREVLIQSGQHKPVQDKGIPGSLSRHAQGIALYRFFMRQTYSSPHPWGMNLGLARVQQIQFDNFNQTLGVIERLGISVVDPPVRTPLAETQRQLRNAGARYFSTSTGWQSNPGRLSVRAARKQCDSCYVGREVSDHYCISDSKTKI